MHHVRISPGRVALVWSHIAAWVERARKGDDFHSQADIKNMCESGKMELWAVMDETGNYWAFLIGRKLAMPVYYVHWFGGRKAHLWLAGGKARLEKRARETGCTAVGFAGRKGLKNLIGYPVKGVYYEQRLS